ncbi:hypothetical protein DYBT9275_02109 [Dyadobacter sp. CECT 9275]|uniref:Hpt domain-containing protein n=1 Tax=Dyadobacter helix TaxID=2822344 RepID=A0A916JB95_9BACT|nr:Hpt domain-containing protein [Dyadobacter sp. CECT 9275]CAG4998922.1 hypothetical protein DYBT9275_02109 [Dyadobacter sp. CECT 9275]
MTLNINSSLDVTYLSQVYGDDASIISMIFEAFVSDSYPRWMGLKQTLDAGNLAEAASVVHGIKPSFTMTGITWLRPKVEEMERAIKANADADTLFNFYAEISAELGPLIPILEEESKRLASL